MLVTLRSLENFLMPRNPPGVDSCGVVIIIVGMSVCCVNLTSEVVNVAWFQETGSGAK